MAVSSRTRLLSLFTGIAVFAVSCAPSTLVEAASGRRIYFYHPDHLGSVSLMTDEQGQVIERIEYAPYGSTSVREGSANVPHQFTGQRLDLSTNLYFYHARYYDPQLGRFIQPDPTIQRPGDPQDLNRYTYARNNPLANVDPTGHGWFKKFWHQIVSAVVGIATTIATGGNVALGFQAYSLSSTALGAGRAIAEGASPGRVFAAVGAGLALGAAFTNIGVGSIGSLPMRMAVFAEQGALIGASNAAIMKGSVGQGALGGAGFGATAGFITSQQTSNWRSGRGFVSNQEYVAAQAATFGAGQGPTYGRLGLVASRGHAGLRLQDASGRSVLFSGKYPVGSTSGNEHTGELQWLLGRTAEGQILNEDAMPQLTQYKTTTQWFDLNQAQFSAAASYMQDEAGQFALTTNCSEWALQGIRTAGVSAPSNLATFGFTDPAKVFEWNGGN